MKITLLILFFFTLKAFSQVGIGTITPAPSAELDVTSTTKGFLPPRMTTTQRNGISSPETGLVIFNTSTNMLEYKSSSAWVSIVSLTLPTSVSNGGTGAETLTGYIKGNGVNAMTASASIPVADVTGAAPLESPAFTSVPTAPTAAAGTNTTQLATTAFVSSAVAAGLLPAQALNANKYLTTNGTTASWSTLLTWNYNGNSAGGVKSIGTNDAWDFYLETGGTEKMRIKYSGSVGIGTSDPDQLLSVNGNASKSGGGSWSTFSDQRLKKEVIDFNDGLNTLLQIKPVSFSYNSKSGYSDTTKRYIGVIAQEIEIAAPYMVESIESKGFEDLKSYDPSALNYILINSVKEINQKLEKLLIEKNELSEQNSIIISKNKELLIQLEKLLEKNK